MRDEIKEMIDNENLKGSFLNKSYDKCLIGICHRMDEGFIPTYDLNKVIEISKVLSKSAQENPIDFFNNKLLKKHPNASFILFSEEKDQNILSKYNHSMLFMDGYSDEALIGVRFMKDKPVVAAYSDTLCLDALMSDGIDYFEYNTRGSFYNNHTPAIVTFY